MSDLLPQLPVPPAKRPQKPTGPNEPLDDFATGFGSVLLIGAQLISKSAPRFAEKVTENILGPQVALGAGIFKYPLPKPGLLLAPAPFGFVEPHNYGLPENYLHSLADPHSRIGPISNPLAPLIPESSYLHTLPDTHPTVKYEEFIDDSRKQRRALEKLTPSATVDELTNLFKLAKGPDAKKHFFAPDDIANSLEASIKARVGLIPGEQIIMRATRPPDAELATPAGPATPTLSAAGFLPPKISPTGPAFSSTADLFTALQTAGANRPKLGPPALNAQKEANDRAPPLLKELASERSDP
jgi:hypothetical protein